MLNLAHNTAPGFTPRRLILEMLAADSVLMSNGRQLIAAGDVFSFSENQIRVALSRLVTDGLLVQPRRGEYAFSDTATALQQEVQHWHDIEQRMEHWHGDWCGILTDNLAAEGSTQFRTQSRALRLRGLRRWRPGLWVRPNNLRGGLEKLGEELLSLGLDAMKGQCVIARGDTDCETSLQSLWDGAELTKNYQRRMRELRAASKRLAQPRFPQMLVETIEVGGDTIRMLLQDPLLPDELASGESRRELLKLLKQYDQQGRRQWQHFIQQL